MPKVTFYPDNREIEVSQGENLLRAAMLAEVHINASCGGEGTCGKCRVLVDEGDIKKLPAPKAETVTAEGAYLACRSEILSDLVVRVPPEARLGERKVLERVKEGTAYGVLVTPEDARKLVTGWDIDPPVKKYHLRLPEPSLEDNLSDLERLRRELKSKEGLEDISVALPGLRNIAAPLREGNWEVTATVLNDGSPQLLRVEPGDTRSSQLGLAIDVGTTTLYVQLIDLISGEVIAQASDYNAQVSCGEDLISRIVYAQKAGHLERLQELATKTLNKLIGEALAAAGRAPGEILHVVTGGNTTMVHLLLGVNPKYLREEPFIPTFTSLPAVAAADVGLAVPEGVNVYLVPSRASWMGGDIVAGVLGSGMFQTDKLTLYVDLGTNGEIVLGNSEWLLACSCSAGPAFEGGTIKHGMRATRGAIEQVRVGKDTFEPMILTIGQTRPKGICGSGLIDAVAELFLAGVIDQRGRYNTGLATSRLRESDAGPEYVLAWADDTLIKRDIVLTEADIDNLIRTKGAIFAGINSLLDSMELPLEAVEQFLVAGGFGNYLQVDKAITIGLFPEIPQDKVTFVGNAVLLGTRLGLLSQEMAEEAEKIAEKMTYLELSTYSAYMDKYVSALFLPHTDIAAFPTVMSALQK